MLPRTARTLLLQRRIPASIFLAPLGTCLSSWYLGTNKRPMNTTPTRACLRQYSSSCHTIPHRPITTAATMMDHHEETTTMIPTIPIPDYLQDVYWWAYVQPTSIWLLDRQFLVNLVLWGNANTLRDAALEEITAGKTTLQVACVYGNFTTSLVSHLSKQHQQHSSSLDVIDVVPDQLERLRRKLQKTATPSSIPVTLSCCNAESLPFHEHDKQFDQAIFYMLLHEMPTPVRRNAIREAIRVLKPGGTLIFIDFHRPQRFWRRALISVWFLLEPFAKDLWSTEIQEWIPEDYYAMLDVANIRKEELCGGLFQKVVMKKL